MSECALGSGVVARVFVLGTDEIALNRCTQPTRPWRQDTLALWADDSVLMKGSSNVLWTQSKDVLCSGVVFEKVNEMMS